MTEYDGRRCKYRHTHSFEGVFVSCIAFFFITFKRSRTKDEGCEEKDPDPMRILDMTFVDEVRTGLESFLTAEVDVPP